MGGEIKLVGPDLTEVGLPSDDIGSEIPAVGHVDGKPVIVLRTKAGLRAVSGRCTHYGGPLGDGLSDGERIHCPWHHAIFDLATGEAVGAPALDPIPVYARDANVTGGSMSPVPSTRPPEERTPPSSPGVDRDRRCRSGRRDRCRDPPPVWVHQDQITLIGDEAPVDRPNLSKDYLAGTAPEDWMPLRGADFYQKNDIDLIVDRRVRPPRPRRNGGSISTTGRQLRTRRCSWRQVPNRAVSPSTGADLPHVHYLRSFEDSRRIIGALDGAKHAVIVGAGFIGLEVAASLRNRGLDVCVVEPERNSARRAVGETLGRFASPCTRSTV